jgi:hypothetical protein
MMRSACSRGFKGAVGLMAALAFAMSGVAAANADPVFGPLVPVLTGAIGHSSSPNAVFGPDAAVGPNGVVAIATVENCGVECGVLQPSARIELVSADSSGRFGAATVIASRSADLYEPRIASLGRSGVALTWVRVPHARKAPRTLMVSVCSWTGICQHPMIAAGNYGGELVGANEPDQPQAISDGTGRAMLVWRGPLRRTRSEIRPGGFYWRIIAGGRLGPVNLIPEPCVAWDLHVALSPHGEGEAVWNAECGSRTGGARSSGIRASRFAGQHFKRPITVAHGGNLAGPRAAVASDGAVVVAWRMITRWGPEATAENAGPVFASLRPADGDLSPPTMLSQADALATAITVGAGGSRFAVAWDQASSYTTGFVEPFSIDVVLGATSRPFGLPQTLSSNVSVSDVSDPPALAADSSGTTTVAWADSHAGLMVAQSPASGGFLAPESIAPRETGETSAAAAAAGRSTLLIALSAHEIATALHRD